MPRAGLPYTLAPDRGRGPGPAPGEPSLTRRQQPELNAGTAHILCPLVSGPPRGPVLAQFVAGAWTKIGECRAGGVCPIGHREARLLAGSSFATRILTFQAYGQRPDRLSLGHSFVGRSSVQAEGGGAKHANLLCNTTLSLPFFWFLTMHRRATGERFATSPMRGNSGMVWRRQTLDVRKPLSGGDASAHPRPFLAGRYGQQLETRVDGNW